MRTRKKYFLVFFLLILLILFLFILNICLGSVKIDLKKIIDVIFSYGDETSRNIILNIRLPRAMAACVCGGALAVSGYLLQTFFQNPIAGPYILGISSGARLCVAFAMIFSLFIGIVPNSGLLVISAFIGSCLSIGIIILISSKIKQMSVLVISGVMIGYICSGITDFIITFADDSDIVNLHSWSQGSFSATNSHDAAIMYLIIIPAFFAAFFMSKPISAYRLGEENARNSGLNIKAFRLALIIVSSILSACVTAFAGPISFVGVAVPHLIKGIIKTSKPILVIPAVFLGGAAFCLFCDLTTRTLFAPQELSISTVTAVFGAPAVIHLLINRSSNREGI